jgi:hypothetical protein
MAAAAYAAIAMRPQATSCSNETSALATLRNVYSAQLEFRERALVDGDRDGKGEFGFFSELSGARFMRGTTETLTPPVLSTAFRYLDDDGIVHRSGYCFRIFLPGRDGHQATEVGQPPAPLAAAPAPSDASGCRCCGQQPRATGPIVLDRPLDADAAERSWYCYAWPEQYGDTGSRSFFINQDGAIMATDARAYSGDSGPHHEHPPQDGHEWTRMD